MDSIYEELLDFYIDDYIIFENTLQRDYYELTNVFNEDANNRNFLQKIWDHILKLFKMIKEKIDKIINNFIAKWDKICLALDSLGSSPLIVLTTLI